MNNIKRQKQIKKLLNRVPKLTKISKIIQSVPLKKLDNTSLVLLHSGLELELERLSKIFNEISDKIKSPVKIKQDEGKLNGR